MTSPTSPTNSTSPTGTAGTRSPLPDPYRPAEAARVGRFIAVEGISGSGKSTVVGILGRMLPARTLHVIPPPLSRLADHVNAHARPLVQAVFYCAGVLHASDSVRAALATGHVVTDRYVNSVLVNHAAVNDVDERVAAALLEPWRDYLAVPDVTVYLDIAEDELLRRMTTRPDLSDSDRMLLKDRRLLRRVLRAYREHAVTDPTGCRLDVDGRKPEDLARSIAALAGVRCAD